MRLAITNCVSQNGGDAAITLALYRRLREAFPDAAIEGHDARPEVAARYYPEIDWKPGIAELIVGRRSLPRVQRWVVGARQRRFAPELAGRWDGLVARGLKTKAERARLADFRNLDAIVSTGGTYLVERYDLTPRFFEYRLAAAAGIPVLFFTQSLGPFTSPRNRQHAAQTFERAPLTLLRDARSERHLREVGVRSERLRVAADGAFVEGDQRVSFPAGLTLEGMEIGMSVRRWPSTASQDDPAVRRFIAAMADAVGTLVRERHVTVTFVSTCQGVPEYPNDDSEVAQAIVDRLDADVLPRVRVDRGFHAPEEFRRIVKGFDLYVATRMHGAIQALVVGTPVVPIAYEFKANDLFRRLGLSQYVIDIDTITAPALVDCLERFTADFAGFSTQLGDRVHEQRAAADTAIDMVCDALRPLAG